jgi:hypothetical protein
MRIPAGGGTPVAITKIGPQESGHVHPWFLPDGRTFLFFVRGSTEKTGIYVGDLEESPPVQLISASAAGVYLPRVGCFGYASGRWSLSD